MGQLVACNDHPTEPKRKLFLPTTVSTLYGMVDHLTIAFSISGSDERTIDTSALLTVLMIKSRHQTFSV